MAATHISNEYCRNLLEESRLRITSIATPEKCRACTLIMKPSAISKINKAFLDHIDLIKLVEIKKNEFSKIINCNVLTEEEVDFIKEARRKMINRKSAGIARERQKCEFRNLECSVDSLKETKRSLVKEKRQLQKEIEYYRNRLQT